MEDFRKATEKQRQVPDIHLGYMFMGDEKERRSVGVFGRQKEGDESCAQHNGSEDVGRLTCLREFELEFVDIIVNLDNEPALTSLVESWSTLRSS